MLFRREQLLCCMTRVLACDERCIKGEADMADNQVILVVFADEVVCDAAVVSLKAWDKASDEVKLNLDRRARSSTTRACSRPTRWSRAARRGAPASASSSPSRPAPDAARGRGRRRDPRLLQHHKGLGMKAEEKALHRRVAGRWQGSRRGSGEGRRGGRHLGSLAKLGGVVEAIDVSDEALEAVAEAARSRPYRTAAPQR